MCIIMIARQSSSSLDIMETKIKAQNMNIISYKLENPLLTSTCDIELLHFNSDMHLLPLPARP